MTYLAALVVRFWPVVIGLWVAAVTLAVAVPPPFEDVAAFDEAIFLPQDAAALRGQQLSAEGWPDDDFTRSATVVFVRRDEPLRPDDEDHARRVVEWLQGPDAPEVFGTVTTHLRDADAPGVTPPPSAPVPAEALTSDDGHVLLVGAGVDADPYAPHTRAAVRTLRAHLHAQPGPQGLETYVAGAAGIAVDEDAAIQASVSRTQALSIVLVVALLYWVFRAPLAPLVPLVTVGAAYLVALGVVTTLAGAGLDVTYLYETFSIVIVFGAGTDYCLLIMSRYGEQLRRADGHSRGDRRRMLVATMAVLAGVVASSAASTIVGFSAQSVAQFGLFRTMGPALAVTVAVTLLAGVTLTPALVQGAGRWLFWPRSDARGRSGP